MRGLGKSIAKAGSGLLVLLVGWWLLLFFSGHVERAYETLKPGELVVIGGKMVSIEEVAQKYQPRIFMPIGQESPPPLKMWYEVIRAGDDELVLIYRPAWENEKHPISWMHILYSVFRASYYGYPLIDSEYIQVNVSTGDGLIRRLRFETGMTNNYNILVSKHLVATATRQPNGDYLLIINERSGEIAATEVVSPLLLDGTRPCLGILTWNHLLVLREEGDRQYAKPVDMELVYLDEREYTRYKFARRSQGDYITPENKTGLFLAAAVIAVVAIRFTIWPLRRRRALF